MDKFVVGQNVRVISKGLFFGSIVTIMAPRSYLKTYSNDEIRIAYLYEIAIDKTDFDTFIKGTLLEQFKFYTAAEEWLEPLEDLNKKVAWNECSWQPDFTYIELLESEIAIRK